MFDDHQIAVTAHAACIQYLAGTGCVDRLTHFPSDIEPFLAAAEGGDDPAFRRPEISLKQKPKAKAPKKRKLRRRRALHQLPKKRSNGCGRRKAGSSPPSAAAKKGSISLGKWVSRSTQPVPARYCMQAACAVTAIW